MSRLYYLFLCAVDYSLLVSLCKFSHSIVKILSRGIQCSCSQPIHPIFPYPLRESVSTLIYINLHYFSPWGQNSFSTMSLIICCDRQPSNVFLNNEMTAHVSNSGLARLVSRLGKDHANQFSLLGIKGSTGCAAPGMGAELSSLRDMYS